MTQRVRTLYFFLTIGLFVVLAPIVVLYAAGYRIDVEGRALLRTGVLTVSSLPRGARASLEGQPEALETPARFSAILPGSYELRLDRTGYHSWVGRVEIEPQRSVVIKEAVLFRSKERPTLLWGDREPRLAIAPTFDRFAAVPEGAPAVEIRSTVTGELIGPGVALSGLPSALVWSPDGQRLAVGVDGRFSILRIQPTPSLEQKLTTPEPLERVWWGIGVDGILYGMSQTGLYRFDLYTNSVTKLVSADLVDFLPSGAGGFVLTRTNEGLTLASFEPTVRTPVPLAKLEGEAARFWPGVDGWFGVEQTDAHQCALYRREGNIIRRMSLPDRCTFIGFHPDGTRAITGDGFELRVVSMKTGEVAVLTRQSRAYRQAFWYPKGRVVLIVNETGVEAIDLANRQPARTALDPLPDPQLVTINSDGKTLLAATREGTQTSLVRLELR